jgi:hypothetical protein
MALTTALIVCALLATELAGFLCLSQRVRSRRKRHTTRPPAYRTSTTATTHRRLS